MIKTEGIHTAEFLLSEGEGQISRENIDVKSGDALPAGQVLGKTAADVYGPYDPAAADGDQVAVGILYAPLDASATTRRAVGIVRLAEVAGAVLTGLDAAAQTALASQHIIVR
jgi:hypothetical protein